MKRILGIVLCVLFIAPLMNVAFAATERIVNGGFETGSFAGWKTGAPWPPYQPTIISSASHSGMYCASFWGGPEDGSYIYKDFKPFFASSDLTFWMSDQTSYMGGPGDILVDIRYSDGSRGGGLGRAPSAAWFKVSIPVDRRLAVVRILLECGTGGPGYEHVYVDDVSLFGTNAKPLLSDGFESGSFGKWSGTDMSPGETATISTARFHHGTHSARFTSNGGGGYERAYCYKTIPASLYLCARGYFYVSRSGIGDEGDRFFFIIFKAWGLDVIYAGWKKTGGAVKWCLTVRQGIVPIDVFSVDRPSLNRWYCVELRWREDTSTPSSDGKGELWVNNVLVCSTTWSGTAPYGDVTQVRFGLGDIYGCTSTTVFCDCAKIARLPIGPER